MWASVVYSGGGSMVGAQCEGAQGPLGCSFVLGPAGWWYLSLWKPWGGDGVDSVLEGGESLVRTAEHWL